MAQQTILLIDDDPFTHMLVAGHLEEINATIVNALSGDEGIRLARRHEPDLILLDLNLPGESGFEVCAKLLNDPATRESPILFLTGSDSADDKVRAFAHGAIDYVTKPFHAAELRARVRAALRTQALLDALETQALSDALTQLPNRVALYRALGKAIERARQPKSPSQSALLFLDLDRFKTINDSLGHAAGDQLLIEIANRLHGCRRLRSRDDTHGEGEASESPSGDIVARIGGDEFAIVLGDVENASVVANVAERIISEISRPFHLDEYTVTCGVSLGVRMIDATCDDVNALVRDADIAMYRAKGAGTGLCVFFDEAMLGEVVERIELEEGLRHAIERGEIELAYQPIVNLSTGGIEGIEALVRWQHPTRGALAPDIFIPVAEETGIIRPLGLWILEESCRQVTAWNETFGAALSMHVNVSKAQLVAESFVDEAAAILRKTGLEPQQLIIEITESMIMHDSRAVVPCLAKLRRLGVQLAMDDFGTGYSSLAVLHRFPLDVLKIDREFVTRLNASRPYAAIVHAIVTLAHNLGLTVIAEGVERHEEVLMLQSLDCDSAQGYFFSKPLPASEVASLIARNLPKREDAA